MKCKQIFGMFVRFLLTNMCSCIMMGYRKRTHVREHIFACTEEKTTRENRRRVRKQRADRAKLLGIGFLALVITLFFSVRAAAIANAGTAVSSRTKYYTSIQIEKGTSLWDIAGDYMTEEYVSQQEYIDEVMQMNHLKSDVIYEGAYLCVPYYSAEQK